MAIKRKNDYFLAIPLKYVNRPRTAKLWAIAHENGHKTRKQRVLGHARKNVLGFTFVVNHPGIPKLWAITHENGDKTQKDEFLIITLKHVNRHGTPKLWALSHENGHKTQNGRLFGQTSQSCKSPWNTKTVGNKS